MLEALPVTSVMSSFLFVLPVRLPLEIRLCSNLVRRKPTALMIGDRRYSERMDIFSFDAGLAMYVHHHLTWPEHGAKSHCPSRKTTSHLLSLMFGLIYSIRLIRCRWVHFASNDKDYDWNWQLWWEHPQEPPRDRLSRSVRSPKNRRLSGNSKIRHSI